MAERPRAKRRPPSTTPEGKARARRAAVRRRRIVALAVFVVLAGSGIAWAVNGRDGTSEAQAESTVTSAAGSVTSSSAATDAATGTGATTSTAPDTTDPAAAQAADRPPPAGPPVTIGWSGDTVPASSELGLPDDPTILLGGVARLLKRPDLMIGNLEGTLTRRGSSKCGAGSSDCYAFRSPPTYARLLAQAGFDVMSLANNHASDYGKVGLADTRAALRSAGLAHTGAPGQVAVKVVNGVRVATIGFASYTWSAPLNDLTKVKRLVQKADGQADIVVVAFHGGAEGSDKQHVPTGGESQFGENRGNLRKFARTAIDAGADLVVGSGPHVVRGMQFYKGRLIAYSAGNFVGYRTFALSGPLSVSFVLQVKLNPDGTFVSGRILPTRLVDPGYAAPDPGGAAIDSVRDLSEDDFGKSAPRIGDDGTILPPAGQAPAPSTSTETQADAEGETDT